jgi:ATP-dependent RNA helicase HelY
MAANETEDLWHDLESMSREHKLRQTTPLDFALAMPIYRWANGARLDTVLGMADLLPGDFIRWSKQIIDLLDQIAGVADEPLATNAKVAVDKLSVESLPTHTSRVVVLPAPGQSSSCGNASLLL